MAIIMDGKLVAKMRREQMAQEVAELKKIGYVPGLAVIIVGDDSASQVYVKGKIKACDEVGIYSQMYALPANSTQQELLKLIDELNHDTKIHGILVQSPLPKHLDEAEVAITISKEKDVDAFHPYNVGKILLGDYSFLPCTPAGIMDILKFYDISPEGKHCVVVGRSNIVGKPMSLLMLHANATVTICHSRTVNLTDFTKTADILIVAVGKAGIITGDMLKKGAVVIDVGMNRSLDGKLCGDVDFASAKENAGYITPVPGGVGPMTITTLLQNTITSAKKFRQLGKK